MGTRSTSDKALSLAYHKLATNSAMQQLCLYPLPSLFARHSHKTVS